MRATCAPFWRFACSMKKLSTVGIVPARGGSKSIPRKNLKPFLGRPLIAWAIEALQKSGVCDRVIVSTEDEEIADVARQCGAEVPFMRPNELAEDRVPMLPVLQHAVAWLKEHEDYTPDYVVLLEPTSVGKRPFHVRGVAEMLRETGADSVFTVSELAADFNPYWQLVLDSEARVSLFTGGPMKNVIKRRQDLPVKTYLWDSAVYAFKPKLLFDKEPSFYGDDARAYIMEPKYALDLDVPEDWEVAERKVKELLESEEK